MSACGGGEFRVSARVVDHLPPQFVLVLKSRESRHVYTKGTQQRSKSGIFHRYIGKSEHEAQCGERVSAAPGGVIQQRMPVQAIRPQVEPWPAMRKRPEL